MHLSERQERIIALADELAAGFAPRADRHDREGTFPHENYVDLRESGYLRLIVPQEYGGEGANLFEIVLGQEHLARGDASTAMAVDMTLHLIGRQAELRSWPEPLFEAICRSIANEGALINAAATEPELGSPSRGGLPSTTATPLEGGYRVNGRKIFVTMAPALRYFVTSVMIPAGEQYPQGAAAQAVVEAGTPGLELVDTWSDALSLRSSGSYDVIYNDVFVPAERVIEINPIGAPAKPQTVPMGMAWFGLSLSGVYLGVGQAALDAITRYANERVPTALGKPIATIPNIQRRIGEIGIALSAARSVLYDVAQDWVENTTQRAGMAPRIAGAKYLCTNAALSATDGALRIAGGFGLTRSLPLERLFRDARAGITHPPNDDAALEMVGKAALKV